MFCVRPETKYTTRSFITDYLAILKTYRKLGKDPTKSHKGKLIKLLKYFKKSGNLNDAEQALSNLLLCTSVVWFAENSQTNCTTPPAPGLRILSSINSVHYETGKPLANILSTVVGKSERHLKNTEDFVKRIRDIQLDPD